MELRAQNSPPFGPTRATNGPKSIGAGPQGIQRVANARFGRRPPSMSARPEQIQTDASGISRSPLAQAIAGTHIASPMILARSPNFLPQGGPISPSFGPTQPGQQTRQQPQIRPQPHHQTARPAFAQTAMASTQSNGSGSSTMSSQRDQNYFVSPFQNHYDQLGKLSHILLKYRTFGPRINPLVQTKSTTPKRTSKTKKTKHSPPLHSPQPPYHHIFSSSNSSSNHNRISHQYHQRTRIRFNRPCHPRKRRRRDTSLAYLHNSLGTTTHYWRRIHLDSLQVCIFQHRLHLRHSDEYFARYID
jgi:hypothetical protein